MHSKWLGRVLFGALVVGVSSSSGVTVGCLGERDPINRVQANALAKTFFLGPDIQDYKDDPEFRTKTFNIDSPLNADSYAGTIGGSSALDRIRWDVTETYLLARRSYQESPGADNHGLPRVEVSRGKWEFPTPPSGTIIAAYKIESHFDIRRDYNPQTGEEINVVVENTTDRPWDQREYMRVDWGTNLVQSTDGDISWLFGVGSTVAPLEYNASNESQADAPYFEIDNGYFDVTNKYQLTPAPLPQFGVPECVIVGFFNGTSSFDCTPTEVKTRSSFVRLTGNEDFEPFQESVAPRDIVGNWNNAGNDFDRSYGAPPITAWDPQYGFTDPQTKMYFSIHNIWEKSHQDFACSDNTDTGTSGLPNGTADACTNDKTKYKGSDGSQCDVYMGKCTIPVRDRQVKTTGYWLNADAPQDLTDVASPDGKAIAQPGPIEESTVTWNQFVRTAIATRREVECRRTHNDTRANCHALYFDGTGPSSTEMVAFGGWGIQKVKDQPVDKGAQAVVTCHNPVRAYDPALCGKKDEVIRLGDIRKNYTIYWPYASRAPYGGVATIGADPLTGEMLGVSATIMMRSATFAAAQQRDIVQLALGDININDVIAGAPASRYADLVKNGKIVDGLTQAKTPEQLAQAVANINQPNIQAQLGVSPKALAAMTPQDRTLQHAQALALSSPQTASIAAADARVQSLIGQLDPTQLKTNITSRGLLRLVAESQNQNTSVYNAIKTFSALDPGKLQDLGNQYQAFLGSRGICFQDPLVTATAGSIYQPAMAPFFKKLYGGLDVKTRGEKIYNDLLREAIKGIGFHEIGHSLGLRHNFASSWDALNFTPQYWQLRTNEGQSVSACTGPRTGTADTCMGPRYLDPMTDDEQGLGTEPRPGIDYFGNTSTMEYQIERFGETVGGGTYDLHAMKTLYGRTLETFDESQLAPADQQLFAVLTLSQGIPADLVFDPNAGYGAHYTKAAVKAKVFDPKRDCRAATDEEKAAAKWRIVHGKVCSQAPKNNLDYEDMKSSEIAFKLSGQVIPIGANGVRWKGLDENNRAVVRWQYRYGEDYSSGGFIHAKLFDSGADVFEITENTIRRFDATYPWAYFRRQNKEFAWWSLPQTVATNVFARMHAYHWTTTTNIGNAQPADLTNDDQVHPDVMASNEMFSFLERVLLTPEPGSYGQGAGTAERTRTSGTTIWDIQTDTEAKDPTKPQIGTLGIIDGRFVQVLFDSDLGGSWDYFNYPSHIGFDEEKVLALREMLDSRPTLSTVSRDNALDGRDPYISFRTDVPHATDRLLGGILAEDWEALAPSMSADGTQPITFNIIDKDPALLVRPAGSKGILFPNLGYQNQIGSGIYAMIFSRFSTDMVMVNKMRIHAVGDPAPAVPDTQKAGFFDPISGQHYYAWRFGTETIGGRAVETGIGSRVLAHANDLLQAAYDTTGGPNAFGELTAVMAGGQPVSKGDPAAEQAYKRYVGFIDGMRQLSNIFGGGPLGGD